MLPLILTLNFVLFVTAQIKTNRTDNVSIFIYPFPDTKYNYIYENCSYSNRTSHNYIVCQCKDVCNYVFKKTEIFKLISFNKPRFYAEEVDKYAFYINEGINNFKINSLECSTETCYRPSISYMITNYGIILISISIN